MRPQRQVLCCCCLELDQRVNYWSCCELRELLGRFLVLRMQTHSTLQGSSAVVIQDCKNPARRYGRTRRGERTTAKSLFIRGQRFTVIGSMSEQGTLGHYILEGSANADIMLEFAETVLVSTPHPSA